MFIQRSAYTPLPGPSLQPCSFRVVDQISGASPELMHIHMLATSRSDIVDSPACCPKFHPQEDLPSHAGRVTPSGATALPLSVWGWRRRTLQAHPSSGLTFSLPQLTAVRTRPGGQAGTAQVPRPTAPCRCQATLWVLNGQEVPGKTDDNEATASTDIFVRWVLPWPP